VTDGRNGRRGRVRPAAAGHAGPGHEPHRIH